MANPPMKKIPSSVQQEALYHDLSMLINTHAGHLQAPEVLAVAANIVGKLVALQDKDTMTPEMAIELITKNINLGNEQALEHIMGDPEGEA